LIPDPFSGMLSRMELAPKTSDDVAEDEIEDEGQEELPLEMPLRVPEAPEVSEAPIAPETPIAPEVPEVVPGSEDTTAEPGDPLGDRLLPEDPAAEPPCFGPGEDLSDEELGREAAALLFASSEPLRIPRLVDLLGQPDPRRVRTLLESLGERLQESGLPIVLRSIGGRWRLLTDPAMGEVVARLDRERKPEKLSGAALETLAIVAYRQPVTKAEVEAIRGVQAGPMLRSLVDRSLLRVTGRAEVPGSPLLYGTTRDFLERFGLDSLKELPRDGELTEH
jgi:segregation and condensation protein B